MDSADLRITRSRFLYVPSTGIRLKTTRRTSRGGTPYVNFENNTAEFGEAALFYKGTGSRLVGNYFAFNSFEARSPYTLDNQAQRSVVAYNTLLYNGDKAGHFSWARGHHCHHNLVIGQDYLGPRFDAAVFHALTGAQEGLVVEYNWVLPWAATKTKGQTCYICTQALHWKTKEGLVRGCSCRGTAGFVHVSCLAEQAKILMDEAEANNLDWDARNARFLRWHACGLCEQQYHGLVYCALGWGCWKTYVGRPETDSIRSMAMNQLGNGLLEADHNEDACSVQEAQLSTLRRFADTENNILAMQNNLAATYANLGRYEDALRMQRDVHSGRLKLLGAENNRTMSAATNYAMTLKRLGHFEEARSVLRKTIPVARRVLGDSHIFTLQMKSVYAAALCADRFTTLDNLREGVTTLEETEPTARRVLGGAHPLTKEIEVTLRNARAALRAREPGSA